MSHRPPLSMWKSKMNPELHWPQWAVDLMVQSRDAGCSYTEIAARITKAGHKASRGAVAGKCSRLGLKMLPKERQARNKLAHINVSTRKPRPVFVIKVDAEERRPAAAKSLMQRGVGECAWPVHMAAEGHLFCCEAVDGKSPYCAHHRAALVIGKAVRPFRFKSDHASVQSGTPVWSEAA